MATDEFSFPTVTDPVPRFAASPSLWRISSQVLSDSCHEDTRGEGGAGNSSAIKAGHHHHQRKSFSYIERGTRTATGDSSEDDVEKMDMLWEDLNDELQRVSSMDLEKQEGFSKAGGSTKFESGSLGEIVELCCVKALKMSKTSNAMFSPRRPSMLVIMKILRKLFLLDHYH